MATIALQAAKIVTPGRVEYYGESASCSFKKGEFVYLDGSGQLVVCATDPNLIAGMAMADASATTGNAIPIYVAEPGVLFELNVISGTSSQVTAVTQVGNEYSLIRDATNKWSHCDIADTTNKVFSVVSLSPKDAVGDAYGRVNVQVNDHICQLGATTS